MTQEQPEKKPEDEQKAAKKAKKSTPGTISLVCSILALLSPFVIPLAGIALTLPLAVIAIVTGALALGTGKGRAGFVLGIFDILLVVAVVIPSSSFFQRDIFREGSVKQQMYGLQRVLEHFVTQRKDALYPVSMTDTTKNGKAFQNFIDELRANEELRPSEKLNNPWTRKPTNIELIPKLPTMPLAGDDAKLMKGDIRIYCNGHEYLIIGGGKKNTPLSFTLKNY